MNRGRNILSLSAILKIVFRFLVIVLLFACEKFEPERTVKIATGSVTNVSYTSCHAQGIIIDKGENGIAQHGFCWAVTQGPTTANNKTELGSKSSTGDFSGILTGLSANTIYYVRAYAQNKDDIFYGDQESFSTLAFKLPTVTTTTISNITESTAQSGGNITDDGGLTVTARGVCWNTSQNPTTTNDTTLNGNGIGNFICSLSELTQNTTYYVRAYATNNVGTAYGNEVNFTTIQTIFSPTVTTSSASDIDEASATVGGNVTDDGGATVTERGIYYSTSTSPETTGTKLQTGSGTGTFSTSLTGLSAGITYYIRAYATNSIGTSYGSEVTFTTLTTPTLTTTAIKAITENSAQSGGNITDDGGASVVARGVCWSISQNPTITDDFTTDGNGTGSFVSSLNGLIPETTYYVRAYATNSVGTAYGNEISFQTWYGSVTDYDGNVYPFVQIGTQVWMAENLKVKHYHDGTTIQLVEDYSNWDVIDNTDKAYCYYNNNSYSGDTYGALYTWAAAMNGAGSSSANPSGIQGICPDGWHVPSDAEWTELTDYLGGVSVAGGKLKETGTTHWNSPNEGATNESGFTALPGGYRGSSGTFIGGGSDGTWWSATEGNADSARDRHVRYLYNDVFIGGSRKDYGRSVRCVRD